MASLAATAAGIDGKWTSESKRGDNTIQQTLTLKSDGGTLTGTIETSFNGNSRSIDIKNGKVDQDTVTFVEILNFQGMVLEISYTGKIVSADQIDFTRKVADIATETLVAKRVK